MYSFQPADKGQVNHFHIMSHSWSLEGVPVQLLRRVIADDAVCSV